jgi:hypothetical protein
MPIVLPDAEDCVKVTFKGTSSGQPWVNGIYMRHLPGTFDQAAAEALAAACHNVYFNAFIPQMVAACQLLQTEVIDLDTRTGPIATETVTHVGTNPASNPAPLQVACCISWRIQDRYRGGHPRMYLAGVSTTFIASGRNWTGTQLPLYQAAADGFLTGMTDITAGGLVWEMVCVRYFSHGQLLTTPLIRDITAATVHNRVDTMRRRLGKELA